MANIKSQIKRNRQNLKARERNLKVRSTLKSKLKAFRSAAESGDKEAAAEAFRVATQALDTAASKGVIKKQTAARRKSRLALALNKI